MITTIKYAYGVHSIYELVEEREQLYKGTYNLPTNDTIIGLIDPKSHEVCALWTRNERGTYPSDIYGVTEYVPFALHHGIRCESDITKVAEQAIKLLCTETAAALSAHEKPLLLIAYCEYNSYLAWSFADGKYLMVHNYKSWREEFNISLDENSEIVPSGTYRVVLPSRQLIDVMGLVLIPQIWESKLAIDKWEPRPLHVPLETGVPEKCMQTYNKAVDVMNKGRVQDLGNDVIFAKLEERVHRFERFCILNAPSQLILKEEVLINKALACLE